MVRSILACLKYRKNEPSANKIYTAKCVKTPSIISKLCEKNSLSILEANSTGYSAQKKNSILFGIEFFDATWGCKDRPGNMNFHLCTRIRKTSEPVLAVSLDAPISINYCFLFPQLRRPMTLVIGRILSFVIKRQTLEQLSRSYCGTRTANVPDRV